MTILLIRTVNGENPQRYSDGDVVQVLPDDHVFGRMESFEVWVSEGRDPGEWPGGFAIVQLDNLMPEVARQWADNGKERRRDVAIDYRALERRTPESGRDTLRTLKKIKRDFSHVAENVKAK